MTARLCNFRGNLSSTPIAVTRRIKRVVVTNTYFAHRIVVVRRLTAIVKNRVYTYY